MKNLLQVTRLKKIFLQFKKWMNSGRSNDRDDIFSNPFAIL